MNSHYNMLSWKQIPLGQIAQIVIPMRDKPKKFDGEIPWIRIEDLEGKFVWRSKSNQKVSRKTIKDMNLKPYPIGTVLCSCSGNMGICAITKAVLISNQTFAGIIPKEYVDSEYLYYILSFYKNKLQALGSGTTILYLSREKFERLIIPVPPVKEMQKINSILSMLDNLIRKMDQIIEQTYRLKKGLMQKLLTKGIGQIKLRRINLAGRNLQIPESWNVSELGTLVEEIRYGTSAKCQYNYDGIPVLRISNIINGNVDMSDMKYAQSAQNAMNSFLLNEGDLIFVRTNGNPNYVGRCAVYHGIDNEYAFASYLIKTSLKKNAIRPDFISYQLFIPLQRKQIMNFARTSAGQYNINTQGLRSLKILIPPLEEQDRIVSMIKNIDLDVLTKQKMKSKIEVLKKGLMQNLLTGRIRVKI